MLGAIIGDVIGSVYEFNNVKRTDFELFAPESSFTDDSLMTIAVARWLVSDPAHSGQALVAEMQAMGRAYPSPMGAYGGRFGRWLFSSHPMPYHSWGNGSAMRVSPVGLYARTLSETLELARRSAEVTHDHPEGIKGAQAIAAAVFLAKEGLDKSFIKDYVTRNFGYDLSRSIDAIRKVYAFDESCQGSVPEALVAFLEGNSFEEVIRLAVSIGGDSDTIACMAGAVAACYYAVPPEMDRACRERFRDEPELLEFVDDFEERHVHSFCFKTMLPADNPRSYWERTTYEAGLLDVEAKTATFADMALRDHSLAACGAQYLYGKGAVGDAVREADMRATLHGYGRALLEHLLEEQDQEGRPLHAPDVQARWWHGYEAFMEPFPGKDADYVSLGEEFGRLVRALYADAEMRPCLRRYVSRHSRVRVAVTSYRPPYTPDAIRSLGYDEIFVFGSNLHGMHGGGAARVAVQRFGAVMGQGVGLQGQSYAIPTMQGSVETIRPYVDEFIRFAEAHPGLVFYVTRIGCGIAGFTDGEIAPLFAKARGLGNVVLPLSFCEVLEG